MGCEVRVTDTGVVTDVHRFDAHSEACNYLETARGYTYERTDSAIGIRHGIAFFKGPKPGERASLRYVSEEGRRLWSVALWNEETTR